MAVFLDRYLKETFGGKLYKISLDGGFTCPNRDGTLGERGCIFCSGSGSGDFAESRDLSIYEQIGQGKKRVSAKMKSGGRYIAYFQAFTGTYAPAERLEKLYFEALDHPDIAVLDIATRPDCLPDDVLDLLDRCNKVKPVWVELGLQTVNEKTAAYIRRGYSLPVYDEAVRKLKERGLNVITHVILGLPGETAQDMKETVKHVAASGACGIKLQLLHVLKGTDLADEYKAGGFEVMSLEDYVKLVTECIKLLPNDMVVHRMTGDGAKRDLIAPLWSGDKKRVLNALHKALAEEGLMEKV